MKDSGVEWIGEIPEHWEVKKMKYIFRFSKGLTITKDNLVDEGVKCINYGEIHSKYGFEINPKIHDLKCVKTNYLKSDRKSLLNYGDLIYADTSEDIEGSGNFTYLNSNIKTFAGYHTVICRPKVEIDSRFFAYEFDSLTFRYQIQRKVKGVKVYSITQGMLKDISLWLPPLSEQQELVKIIDNKTSKLDKAINLQQKQIEKLKEYKTTLIDSVVTGKVRVV
jgi:type I restriction enzyme S subunit